MNVATITQHCITHKGCSTEQAEYLALHATEEELLHSANTLREHYFSNNIELCVIVNAKSGHCGMDCKFCSQSSHNNTLIDTYPLMSNEALEEHLAHTPSPPIHRLGIVTSGGALSDADVERLALCIESQPKNAKLHICGSLGRLKTSALKRLQQAGMTRIHHNLESSESFYPQVCSTQTWQDRLDTVRTAQKLGLEVCCGGLFGLGETWADRIDFAFALKQENITQIPLNFLYAHTGTPLAHQPVLSEAQALRIIALWRHILPEATLRICGGRAAILKDRQADMFRAGANAFMTGNYLTVAGSELEDDLSLIKKCGLSLAPQTRKEIERF